MISSPSPWGTKSTSGAHVAFRMRLDTAQEPPRAIAAPTRASSACLPYLESREREILCNTDLLPSCALPPTINGNTLS